MMPNNKVVVLTPVKNEAWILDRFLSVTSKFADYIIILDQNSNDGSLDIYKKYSKVIVYHNQSDNYDEAERQLFLINKAREVVPGPKILLALDADEVVSANALNTPGWRSMLNAEPGTILYFEKPDLYLTYKQAIRYTIPFPLGYVDDGAEHKPVKIHSYRVPHPPLGKKLFLEDIKVLHYTLTRIEAQKAKMMYYSMLENILGTSSFLARRSIYKTTFDYVNNNRLEESPKEWFEGWEKQGIDMYSIDKSDSFWYDEEALKLFQQYGYKKFWLENIWNKDWNSIARKKGMGHVEIKPPPVVLRVALRGLDLLYYIFKKVKK